MRADENRASRLRGYPTVGEPHAESLARFEFRPEHVRRRARPRRRVPPRASDVRVVLVQRAVRVRRDDDRVIPLRSLRAVRGRPPRRRVEIRVGVRTVLRVRRRDEKAASRVGGVPNAALTSTTRPGTSPACVTTFRIVGEGANSNSTIAAGGAPRTRTPRRASAGAPSRTRRRRLARRAKNRPPIASLEPISRTSTPASLFATKHANPTRPSACDSYDARMRPSFVSARAASSRDASAATISSATSTRSPAARVRPRRRPPTTPERSSRAREPRRGSRASSPPRFDRERWTPRSRTGRRRETETRSTPPTRARRIPNRRRPSGSTSVPARRRVRPARVAR